MKKIIIFFIILGFLFPFPSLAFNEDFIISDHDFEDYTSMDANEIRDFLIDKNSFLAFFADFYPETGVFMDAAEIIWRAAQKFKLNPKVILTLLEKEQSLISYQLPSQRRLDWALGYAVCDNCELAHPLVAKYKGFAKQVYYAADRIRNTYLVDLERHGKTHTGYGPGISRKIDYKYWVTPQNNATAVLYTYTPHYLGNRNFYLIWKKWFSNITYPDGSLLQDAKTGGIYLIQSNTKRPFLSKAAFASRFDKNNVIVVSSNVLKKYPDGHPIKFADYSLLRTPDKNLYMTVGDQVRPFQSQEVFRSLGFSPFELEDIEQSDLAGYSIGSPITQKSAYPTGALLQLKSTGGVYFVYDGIKYPILHPSVLKARFSNYSKIIVDDIELEKFDRGEPVRFLSGTLVKGESSPTVYFISKGMLRPIPSEDVFLAYGWEWGDIIWTADKVLSLYQLGAPISLDESSLLEISAN